MDIMSFYLTIKFTILKALRKPTLSWFHTALQHLDIQQTEITIYLHLVWPEVSKDAEKHIQAVIKNNIFKYLAPSWS
jgi:hypothetical protein